MSSPTSAHNLCLSHSARSGVFALSPRKCTADKRTPQHHHDRFGHGAELATELGLRNSSAEGYERRRLATIAGWPQGEMPARQEIQPVSLSSAARGATSFGLLAGTSRCPGTCRLRLSKLTAEIAGTAIAHHGRHGGSQV